MRKTNTCIFTLLLPVALLTGISKTEARVNGAAVPGRQAAQLWFVENKGQVKDQHGVQREDIDFRLTAANGLNMFVGNGTLHYQWIGAPEQQENVAAQTYRMDVSLIGANPKARIVTEDATAYHERYYHSGTIQMTAQSWGKIIYKEIYPNIDWVLYTRNGMLEYDFVVHPGGNVSDIRLRYDGAGSLRLNENGSLTAFTPMGTITENAPVSFAAGGKKVQSRFRLDHHILSFDVAAYEGTLVIDPVLEWSTYYGGTGSDYGRRIAVDSSGAVYMTGSVLSGGTNLATIGAHQGSYGGAPGSVFYGDAYLVKFDQAGNRLWATYFGGAGSEGGWDIACDEQNNVYITGQASSTTAISGGNSFQATYGGGSSDAFLAKFDSSGHFIWGTYYGGSALDEGWGVACDMKGHVYLAGRTSSSSGIASGGAVHQPAIGGGQDGFLVKFDTAGNRQWATYFGGTGTENTWVAMCDNSGNVYICGETGSPNNIASTNGHQTIMTPSNGSEAFLIKFAPDGTNLWGTYYGGNQPNQVWGTDIAVDDSNYVYLTGFTTSTVDIATPGSHQPLLVSGYTSYLVKFDSTGSRIWGTYFGGTGSENGNGVTCDPWGNVYITGYTSSPDNIATAGALQQSLEGGNDIYLSKFNRDGVRLWGTYYGGSGFDAGWDVVADRFGSIYVTGFTGSGGLATGNAYQPVYGGGSYDGYLLRISECTAVENLAGIGGTDSLCAGTSAMYGITPVAGAHSYSWTLPSGWLGNSTTDSILVTADNMGGIISVVANGTCNTSDTVYKEIFVHPEPIIDVTVNGIVLGTIQDFASYQWYMNNLLITGATDSTYTVIENGVYSVRVVDEHGCNHISRPYPVNNVSVETHANSDERITIYPNPAQDIVYIHSIKPVQAAVRSIEGRIISRHENASQINISGLPEGLYFLQIMNEKGQLLRTERLIKAERQ